jgi:hypothetical protein
MPADGRTSCSTGVARIASPLEGPRGASRAKRRCAAPLPPWRLLPPRPHTPPLVAKGLRAGALRHAPASACTDHRHARLCAALHGRATQGDLRPRGAVHPRSSCSRGMARPGRAEGGALCSPQPMPTFWWHGRSRCLPLAPGGDGCGKAQRPFERFAAPMGDRNVPGNPAMSRGQPSAVQRSRRQPRGGAGAALTGPPTAAQTKGGSRRTPARQRTPARWR